MENCKTKSDKQIIIRPEAHRDYKDTEHVKFQTLPAVRVASCVVNGGYEQIPEVYGAVISWVKENGYEPCGTMFNIYHVSPYET